MHRVSRKGIALAGDFDVNKNPFRITNPASAELLTLKALDAL